MGVLTISGKKLLSLHIVSAEMVWLAEGDIDDILNKTQKSNRFNRVRFNDLGDHRIGIPDPLQYCGKASYRYDSPLLCQCGRAPIFWQ